MTAQLSLVERPELTVVGLESMPAEPVEIDQIEEYVPLPDPIDPLFDGWFRLMTAPIAAVAPGPVDAVRTMIGRLTHVDELM